MKAAVHPTRWWHTLDDGRVQCDVCPRACKLHEGQRGFCFVRAREGDEIVLTTYGRSSRFCVDPIEKKPLNHFLPGTPVLSFGTAGCNLGCKFCQNWDISKSREIDTLADAATPEVLAEAALQLGCRSVAFTYNDPVIFLEYAIDVADASRERGIKAVAVSAGYICPEPRVELYEHMDAANVDLKAFTESLYADTCAGRLQPVLETLEYLRHETEVWFEITTLLIPGLTTRTARSTRSPAGSSSGSGRTCRSTSPPSTPTTGCSTGRRHRPRRSPAPAGSHSRTASATRTRATSTTSTAAAPTATAAASA
jgi:pyruvate formate lyase activating enzyme